MVWFPIYSNKVDFTFSRTDDDDYEDFPVVPLISRFSGNDAESEYFKAPRKRYRKF